MGTPTEPTPRQQILLVAVLLAEVAVVAIFVTIALVALT
jgi:hypothetical protein